MAELVLFDSDGRGLALPQGVRVERDQGTWLVREHLRLPLPAEPEDLTLDQLELIHHSIPGSSWLGA